MTTDAQQLLFAAAKGDGTILTVKTFGGTNVQAGGREFVEEGDARSAARWTAALQELERHGTVKALSYKRELFEVTHLGYQTADKLQPATTE